MDLKQFLNMLSWIGAGTVILAIFLAVRYFFYKFRRWRKSSCKCKLLCKPHIYDFYYLWPGDGELTLKCKKCGKVKKLYVDVESFEGVFDEV